MFPFQDFQCIMQGSATTAQLMEASLLARQHPMSHRSSFYNYIRHQQKPAAGLIAIARLSYVGSTTC